jgi:hypothetical protein
VETKTHFRKAFDSPYLSSADIVGPTVLTIARVSLELDRTKKTKDLFNTAHFVERELRPGEPLKPMILNATNSGTLKKMTGSPFLEDWLNVRVTVFVDHNVKFGREITEGLRLSPRVETVEVLLTPGNKTGWANATAAYKRDGNLDAVLARVSMSQEHQAQLIKECGDGLA